MSDDYPVDIPLELRDALDSFEGEEFDRLVEERRADIHAALVLLATTNSPIPPRHRQRAVHGLGLIHNPEDVDIIAAALPRLDELGTATAAISLGRIGSDAAVTLAAGLGRHESEQVRKFVVKALSHSRSATAQSELRRIAEADTSPWVRDLAAQAISGTTSDP